MVPLDNPKTPEPLHTSAPVCMTLSRPTSSCTKFSFIKTEGCNTTLWPCAVLLLPHYQLAWMGHSSVCFHIGTKCVTMWYIWESSAEFGWYWSRVQGRDKENRQDNHISLISLENMTKQIDFCSSLTNILKYVAVFIGNISSQVSLKVFFIANAGILKLINTKFLVASNIFIFYLVNNL